MVWVLDMTLSTASNLRDTGLLQLLHTRLSMNQNLTQHVANKVVDMHEDVKPILAKTQQSANVVQRNQQSSMGGMSLSKKLPSCLSKRKHLTFVFSAQAVWERLQLR